MELVLQQTGQEIWQTCGHAGPAFLMGQDLIVVPDSMRQGKGESSMIGRFLSFMSGVNTVMK